MWNSDLSYELVSSLNWDSKGKADIVGTTLRANAKLTTTYLEHVSASGGEVEWKHLQAVLWQCTATVMWQAAMHTSKTKGKQETDLPHYSARCGNKWTYPSAQVCPKELNANHITQLRKESDFRLMTIAATTASKRAGKRLRVVCCSLSASCQVPTLYLPNIWGSLWQGRCGSGAPRSET